MSSGLHPVVQEIEDYINSREFDSHAFFQVASESKKALALWVTQELVMTNAFSQIVLLAAAHIHNVHLRSMMVEIASGEHGATKGQLAINSHPYLLDKLRISLGIMPSEIRPRKPTIDFLRRLHSQLTDQITAVAAIGSGNERLIVPEYKAIKRCFALLYPDAAYEPFLQANLSEDILHSRLCYIIATEMIALGADANKYFAAAVNSVESRSQYFDELLKYI
jgi:hypothetical protein